MTLKERELERIKELEKTLQEIENKYPEATHPDENFIYTLPYLFQLRAIKNPHTLFGNYIYHHSILYVLGRRANIEIDSRVNRFLDSKTPSIKWTAICDEDTVSEAIKNTDEENWYNLRQFTLKELRKRKGLTQKQVAEAVGISMQAYQAYEYGNKEPRASMAVKLAKALDSTVEQIAWEI